MQVPGVIYFPWTQGRASMQAVAFVKEHVRRGLALFDSLDRRHKTFAVLGIGAVGTIGLLSLVFHASLLRWLTTASERFRGVRLNWLMLLTFNIAVSFPPIVGYSALSLFVGMVFGFPKGWPLLAFGTLVGSTLSFLTFRYLLRSRAEALARRNLKFMALVEVLRQDSFVLLWMIRLCPLPYSFSNAAMSTIPSIEPWKFFLSTLAATPKLFLHLFVGSQIVKLSEEADNKKWWVNLFSIFLAVSMGLLTSFLIYRRTKEKAAALEQQHGFNQPAADDFEISGDVEETF